MDIQFQFPKRVAVFLLGNVCFGFYLANKIHFSFGLLHSVFASLVLITGFGEMQLYPYAYWSACTMFSLWFIDIDRKWQHFVLRSIALVGIVVAVHALLQVFGFVWPLTFAEGVAVKPIAFMGQQTKLGAYLAPISALCLSLGWVIPALFVAFIALMTGSSFTAMALAAGLAVSARFYYGRKATSLVVAIGIVSAIGLYALKPFHGPFAFHGRDRVWIDALEAIKKSPIVGYGPGSFKQIFDVQFESKETAETFGHFREAHNDYIQCLFEFGLVGLLSLFVALFYVAKSFKAYWKIDYTSLEVRSCLAMLAALLVNALGNFPAELAPHFLFMVFSGAVVLRATREVDFGSY